MKNSLKLLALAVAIGIEYGLLAIAIVVSVQWQFVDAGARSDERKLNQFMDWGVSPNVKSTIGGITALRFAIYYERWSTVRLLLNRGADPNDGLHMAIGKGRLDIVKLLVEKGADVNAKAGYSSTPLEVAITNENKEMIRYLRSKGAK